MDKEMLQKGKVLQRGMTLRRLSDLTRKRLERMSSFTSFTTRRHRPSRWGVIGVRRTLGDDTAFILLDMEWMTLFLLIVVVYAIVSAIFAVFIYVAMALCKDGEHMLGELSPHLSRAGACWWLSVTNLTTVGYGSISPETTLAYALCTSEHFCGLLLSSLLLGVVVTKASIPTGKIVFSKVCLMTTRNGVPHLLVRIGNIRGNFLLKPEIRMFYMQKLVTVEGEVTYRGKRLEVSDPHALAPTLILSHEINEASPLHGLKDGDLRDADGAVCVSVAAVDDHSLQEVYAKIVFEGDSIVWNHRFSDVLVRKGGRYFVDFRRFHETEPISVPEKKEGQELAEAAETEMKQEEASATKRDERQLQLQQEQQRQQEGAAAGAPKRPPRVASILEEEGDEDRGMQHADLLRHGRLTSVEHSTSHLLTDRRALRNAFEESSNMDGSGVLARLRRRSMFPAVPEHAHQPVSSDPPQQPPQTQQQAQQQQPQPQPQQRRQGLGRLKPPAFRPPRPPQH